MKLVKLNTQNVAVMSSMELAEFTGKRHDNMLRDIKAMFAAIGQTEQLLNFEEMRNVTVNNGAVRQMTCYAFPEKEALFVASKFKDDVRWKIITEFEELKKAQAQPKLPTTNEAFVHLFQQAVEVERKLEAHQELLDHVDHRVAAIEEAQAKVVEVPAGYKPLSDIKRDHAPWLSDKKVRETLDFMNWPFTTYSAANNGYINHNARAYQIVKGKELQLSLDDFFSRIFREARQVTNMMWEHRCVPGRFTRG